MDEWHRSQARKRGGGIRPISLDTQLSERLYASEPGAAESPDHLYDYHCALVLLSTALEQLERDFAAAGKAAEFQVLKPQLTAARGEIDYEELGKKLGCDIGAARVAVHRFRKRYRQAFREQVAQTVARPEDVEGEVQCLVAAVGGQRSKSFSSNNAPETQ